MASGLCQAYYKAVRLILRKGWRLVLRRNGYIEVFYDKHPPTAEDEAKLGPLYEAFARRLRKPPGWPADIPLPVWWSDLALGFDILEAARISCSCGFPVAVLIYFREGCRWHCPACGKRVTVPIASG